jgi:hypothetical protein
MIIENISTIHLQEIIFGSSDQKISKLLSKLEKTGKIRKLTRQGDPKPYIKMLQRAAEFSETIYGDDYSEMLDILTRCNSFSEHTEAKLKIIKR